MPDGPYLISPVNFGNVGVITHGAPHDPLTLFPPAPNNKNQEWQLVRITRDRYTIIPFELSDESDSGFSWAGGRAVSGAPITFDKPKVFILSRGPGSDLTYRVQLVSDEYGGDYVGYNPESEEVQITDSPEAPFWKFAAIN